MASFLKTLLLGASIALAGAVAHADSAAPIRLIIGFPPGGALDSLARSLAEDLRTTLKEPVLVENRPGASTRISIEAVKAAKPDGRTILLGATPPFVLFPMTYARLNYDVDKDFVPLAHLANVPSVISAGANQPFKTLAEYVAWVRKNPSGGSVGLTNLGGGLHFSLLQLSKAIGVPLTPITYRGGAPLLNDVLGGQVPVSVSVLGEVMPYIRAGKLRGLAVSSAQRSPFLPEVPTFVEQGFPDIVVQEWLGWFLPARAPSEIVQRLNALVREGLAAPEFVEALAKVGLQPMHPGADELARIVRADRQRWAPIVKAAHFTAED